MSYYITSDAGLADKIRAHRWYKEGRINEVTVNVEPTEQTPVRQPEEPKTKKTYSILGRPMANATSAKPVQAKTEIQEPEIQPQLNFPEVEEKVEETPEPVKFKAEDVTSFMEAKEFFIQNYGIARSECANKAMLESLCHQYNVVFPNYL